MALHSPTTPVATRKWIRPTRTHRAPVEPAPETPVTLSRAPSVSGISSTTDRKAAFSGVFSTRTSPKARGLATTTCPELLRLIRRPLTTWCGLRSVITCHNIGRASPLTRARKGSSPGCPSFFFARNVHGELDGKMLAGGWLETVMHFCQSPQALAAALQTNSPQSGGGIAGSYYRLLTKILARTARTIAVGCSIFVPH